MRKWALTGFIGLVIGAGITAFLLTRWEGRVEYHKRQFRNARNETKTDPPQPEISVQELKVSMHRMETAQKALVDLGYLTEMRFPVSNQTPSVVGLRVAKAARHALPKQRLEFCDIWSSSNAIGIICLSEDSAKWKEFVKGADVPQ